METVIDKETAIGLLGLKVSELQRSIRFYTEVVGYRLLKQEGRTAELTVDGVRPSLRLEEVPDALPVPRRSAAGLYHFAILVPDRRSLGVTLRNLLEHGLHVGQGDHLVSEAFYITDPDLNGIEIYADRPREGWIRDEQGHYVMSTDPVDAEGLLREAEGYPWTGLPAGTVTGHIHLHVSHLQEAEKFYVGLLGFEKTAGRREARALHLGRRLPSPYRSEHLGRGRGAGSAAGVRWIELLHARDPARTGSRPSQTAGSRSLPPAGGRGLDHPRSFRHRHSPDRSLSAELG
ncbi:Glyoxalase/bleomycin resistance protein/dioxygenase [Paenibacillus mucilaginosus 3016]|uniref:Glyoxalase/bleomycin resistance protein/dioxygenase n=1 Tax=Paenibacillus mucilaginosus 3016 TaxID=1116391 RepID=H6NNQ5_9BACL|nr:Glyoxalase/bleomycin resistance protein/dioxygenase [Paenibacillus mucilaginosus 3016]